jgi:putative heme-binding domain-containing protein
VPSIKRHRSAVTRGKQAFLKAQCLQCHVASGFGASLGPDLVESVKTYRGAKLLQQIIEPSTELHPKYRTIQFLLDSGKVVVGSIIKEDAEAVYVATDLMLPQNLTKLSKDEIEQQKVSELSAMPHGLLNTLTKQEILDLHSLLEAGVDSTMGLNEQAEKK